MTVENEKPMTFSGRLMANIMDSLEDSILILFAVPVIWTLALIALLECVVRRVFFGTIAWLCGVVELICRPTSLIANIGRAVFACVILGVSAPICLVLVAGLNPKTPHYVFFTLEELKGVGTVCMIAAVVGFVIFGPILYAQKNKKLPENIQEELDKDWVR